MKLRVALVLYLALMSVVVFSCRRNKPSLVDANRPPDTELWYAPPDSTEQEYLVNMFWRGVDVDGVTERYIWTITDTLQNLPFRWNPSIRAADFQRGRITSRTDSVFSFQGFIDVGGVSVKKNRQAFHVAAIDDRNVIDPSPAAIEFIATVEELPKMFFTSTITRVTNGMVTTVTMPDDPARIDTVGMFRPFRISYHGATVNGQIRGYRYQSLTSGIVVPGQSSDPNNFNSDLGDTLRIFPNVGPDALPSGRLRFAAQTIDDAGAKSPIDGITFSQGVVVLEVNFEPDTEMLRVLTFRSSGGTTVLDSIDITDSQPDTVPFDTWITLGYIGRDNPSDSTLCPDPINKCLGYQTQYTRTSTLPDDIIGSGGFSLQTTIGWEPNDPYDTNIFGQDDSVSMNVGPSTYAVRTRAVDEFGKPDGTPTEFFITGNYPPRLKTFNLQNYDGTVINDGDTIVWEWFKPANLGVPPTVLDTLDVFVSPNQVKKEWFFVIAATGEDDPREVAGQGVTSWVYEFEKSDQTEQKFARSGFWNTARTTNALGDTVRLTVNYDFANPQNPTAEPDTYAARPAYLDKTYTFRVQGRDTALGQEFFQFMFTDIDTAGVIEPDVIKEQINRYNVEAIGGVTQSDEMTFYITLKRP